MARPLREVAAGRRAIKALRDHEVPQVLGRTDNGTLTLVHQPATGLRATVEIDPNVSYARDVLASWQRRDLRGGSFAFAVVSEQWSMDADGTPLRLIEDMIVEEVSVVLTPAYPMTERATLHGATSPTEGRSDRCAADAVARRVRTIALAYPDRDLKFSVTYSGDEPKLALRSSTRRAYRPSLAMRRRQLQLIESEL